MKWVTTLLALGSLSICVAARADVSEATFMPQGSATYVSTQPSQVEIFVYKPDFKFKIIGVIDARGMAGPDGGLLSQLDITNYLGGAFAPGEKEDMALAVRALKLEAARAGATAVIIIQSQQVPVSSNSTERRIKAAAIVRADQ
jgi:hypothetical protein